MLIQRQITTERVEASQRGAMEMSMQMQRSRKDLRSAQVISPDHHAGTSPRPTRSSSKPSPSRPATTIDKYRAQRNISMLQKQLLKYQILQAKTFPETDIYRPLTGKGSAAIASLPI